MIGRRSRRRIAVGALWALLVVVVAGSVLALVDVLAGPFVFLSTRLSPPELRDGARIGAIEGAIKSTEADSGTVVLPHGFLGLASLPVVVTEDTHIAVGGKLGGFGDLERGQMVRIAYEVSPDGLVARRIEVLNSFASVPGPSSLDTGAEPASFALPRASAPATVNSIAPRAAPLPSRAPATASAAACKDARRAERLPMPRPATVIHPMPAVRPVERVIVAPAPLVSHSSDILRVTPSGADTPPAQSVRDRPVVDETKQAP